MNIAATGLTETAACDAGFDVGCTWGTFSDKPDYYPEVQNIHLKVVYDKSTQRLLGLQGYGMGDVVKRVDVFAALLKPFVFDYSLFLTLLKLQLRYWKF